MRLSLTARPECKDQVVCYTAASLAPYGSRSYGAAVITVGGAKLSFVTLLVMEAELYAATQRCILLESVAATVDEVRPGLYSGG